MAQYEVGDKVEYRPIGGASDNVAHSTGEITNIQEEDGERYYIKNDNTGKETGYLEMNIVQKI